MLGLFGFCFVLFRTKVVLCPLVGSSYSPASCSADLQGQAELAAARHNAPCSSQEKFELGSMFLLGFVGAVMEF